jgi:hypothetical protein
LLAIASNQIVDIYVELISYRLLFSALVVENVVDVVITSLIYISTIIQSK